MVPSPTMRSINSTGLTKRSSHPNPDTGAPGSIDRTIDRKQLRIHRPIIGYHMASAVSDAAQSQQGATAAADGAASAASAPQSLLVVVGSGNPCKVCVGYWIGAVFGCRGGGRRVERRARESTSRLDHCLNQPIDGSTDPRIQKPVGECGAGGVSAGVPECGADGGGRRGGERGLVPGAYVCVGFVGGCLDM